MVRYPDNIIGRQVVRVKWLWNDWTYLEVQSAEYKVQSERK